MKELTLVKYNYDSFPADWKKNNPNKFDGIVFIYFGEIHNMIGHCYCKDIKTGIPYVLETENLIPLTEDEL